MITGKLFECDVLGNGTKVFCMESIPQYKPWKKAMVEVIEKTEYSKWDPSDPDTRVCNDLHATVAMQLDLEDWNQLKLYPAIGSSFDIHHGVDMFFMLNEKYVTIDLSMNDNKGKYKADITVTPDMLEDLPMLAEGICKYFKK